MTFEEISKAIEECEKRLKCLREELNRPEYSGKRWKPKLGEDYFYVNACGVVFTANWHGEDDEELYAFGNVFSTQEAAEFEVERRKVIAELSDYAEDEDMVWDGNTKHWTIVWNTCAEAIIMDYHVYFTLPLLYFPSEEAARAAVKAVGEERVKKYYLGVRE